MTYLEAERQHVKVRLLSERFWLDQYITTLRAGNICFASEYLATLRSTTTLERYGYTLSPLDSFFHPQEPLR